MGPIIVTGSAGYIGGQTALLLGDLGYTVYGIDRREPPPHLRGVVERFLYQDFASDVALSWIVNKQPSAVIHCAGTSLVGPSIKDPSEYYNNNVAKTLKLLDTVRTATPNTRVIFSSSAATYGVPPSGLPCQEHFATRPISPYGESKLMIEQMLQAYRVAYNLDFVALRYFNACGADPQARHGQEPNATHIIARVLESIRDNQTFTLNGTDFDTFDRTCVRDYVHVEDIARAHVLSLSSDIPAGIYNLGSAKGTSNREIRDRAQRITQRKLDLVEGPRRKGDPDALTADPAKFDALAGNWKKYSLDDMIQHAWNWYTR